MSSRTLQIGAIAAAALAVASFSATAQETTTPMETHQMAAEHKEAGQSYGEHEAAALRFENEAKVFDRQVAEHEQMATEYRKLARLNPKSNYASLANHCDRLAKNLEAAAEQAREMARLHHDVAKLMIK